MARLSVLSIIVGSYYKRAQKKGTVISITETITQPSRTSTEPMNICVEEAQALIELVTRFETLQQNKDGVGALRLFTLPQEKQDIQDYAFLSGEDEGVYARLYNNGQTNYNTISYAIMNAPAINLGDFCTVAISEQRSSYGGPANPQYLPAVNLRFDLVLTRQNGVWKIERYESTDTRIRKTKYAGFLMSF